MTETQIEYIYRCYRNLHNVAAHEQTEGDCVLCVLAERRGEIEPIDPDYVPPLPASFQMRDGQGQIVGTYTVGRGARRKRK